MCLIVFAPNARRARLNKAYLSKGFDKNDDGAGFAYVQGGKVIVSKAYFRFEDFYAAYKPYARRDGPILIHFRWGTKGSKCARNTQPLVVQPERLVMAHNGIFHGLSQCEEDVSDSVKLARLLKSFGWALPFSQAQTAMLEALCYKSNKLVFLSNTGRHLIINEDAGIWRAGAWYSDKHGAPPKRHKVSIIQTKLPMGTRFDMMTEAQKARVTAWEKLHASNPTLPPPWSGPYAGSSQFSLPLHETWD